MNHHILPGDGRAEGLAQRPGIRRRTLLGTAAAGAALTAVPRPAWSAPADLPTGTVAAPAPYVNWATSLQTAPIWTCAANNRDHLVALANWAAAKGWRLRVTGARHTWAPITLAGTENSNSPLLLVDARAALGGVKITSGTPASVTVGAGVMLETLLFELEHAGYGITNHPAPGNITIGGALAIDGHGTSIACDGESLRQGHTWGTLSNLVLSMTAVVWDQASAQFVRRTFTRTQVETAALMVHLGRAVVTDVTLRVGKLRKLRCISRTDIPASELMAAPGTGGRTVDSFLHKGGRIEVIWFPYTDRPWFKWWQPADTLPFGSRWVPLPYNYPFSDLLTKGISDLVTTIRTGNPSSAPRFGSLQFQTVEAGLNLTLARDLWGMPLNTMLYIRPTTLRMTANGYAIVTSRANVQKVVHETSQKYWSLLQEFNDRGKWPINGPLEIRVAGLDNPADVGVSGAQTPLLSAAQPVPGRPELDCVVWFDVLTLPGTPSANEYYAELEAWLWQRYDGTDAVMRVEWSKGWGYTPSAGWANSEVLTNKIPASLPQGSLQQAADILDSLDPKRVFSSPLLDALLP